MKIPNSNHKEKLLAALYTLLISGVVFAGAYFFKVKRNVSESIKPFMEKPKVDSAKINAENTVDSLYNSTEIYLPPVVSNDTTDENIAAKDKPEPEQKVAETKPEEKPKAEEKKSKEPVKTAEKTKEKSKTETAKASDKKTAETKKTTKEKTAEKEEKAKNFVTVSYVIDKNGNFTTAQRIDGLRDRTSINKAIAYVKKNIKGKKGKETKGTYTYKL